MSRYHANVIENNKVTVEIKARVAPTTYALIKI